MAKVVLAASAGEELPQSQTEEQVAAGGEESVSEAAVGEAPLSTSAAQAAGFLPTSVPGIFAMPGGKWGTEESHAGAWGYFVPQGQSMRKVDTSHVTEGLACLIQCLKPELALPWGFLIMEPDETVALIDVPYFSEEFVKKVESLAKNGLKYIIFTHSDFIGMAEPQEWRRSFPSAEIIAHRDDVLSGGAMESETLLEGPGPWHFSDYRIDPAPGHTKGSVIVSSSIFSTSFGGDSMGFWDGGATGYPKMARHSCKEQARSLRSFSDAAPFFKYWFLAHGLPLVFADELERRQQLLLAADELEKASVNDNVTAP